MRCSVLLGCLLVAVGCQTASKVRPSFPDNDIALKQQLLLWESEAPEKLQGVIARLRSRDSLAKGRATELIGETTVGKRAATLALVEALRDGRWLTRTRGPADVRGNPISIAELAVYALGEIGEPAVPSLIGVLKDESYPAGVRVSVIGELYSSGDTRAIPAIIHALRDDEESIRSGAALRLGYVNFNGDTRSVEPLINALKDPSRKVRKSAARALRYIGDPRAVEPLIQLLEDSDNPRFTVIVGLGEFGDDRAVEPLIEALKDGSRSVRYIAAKALGMIGDTRAVEPLIEALKDNEEKVRTYAAVALGSIGDDRAVEPLTEALRVGGGSASTGEWGTARRRAAEALGNIGAVEPLVEALKDDEEPVRDHAAMALGSIGDVRAVEPLIEALEDSAEPVRRHAAMALGMIGDVRAVDPLIKALEDGEARVRDTAAEWLGRIGDERAVEALIDARSRWRGGSRFIADAALRRLNVKPESTGP